MTTVTADVARRADEAVTDVDTRHCRSALDDLDLFGLHAMLGVLRKALPDNVTRNEEQIATRLGVAARHRWLLRRWLRELTDRGQLSHCTGRGYDLARPAAAPQRTHLRQACADLGLAPELAQFFDRANRQLAALLQERVLPQELLFPDGDFLTAEAAYRTNPVNRYLNVAAREVVSRVVAELRQRRSPVRILELGAGVGGTTADIVGALGDSPVDYHFTDLSAFFLTAARARFADHPWMRYGILDLNADLPGQPPCDIVLAANVLHNARHTGQTLRHLARLLAPGGQLVFVESCREHCQLLTSMHFLMSPRTGGVPPGQDDVRAGTDRIFLRVDEWLDALTAVGLEPWLVLPEADHPLAAHGQRIFVARKPGSADGERS
ncbi:class I SAM-dependent methyltransferase [Nocardia mexicana]|uniref:Methyltransferase family protein n=1 Tax=Nocardia mexicana TaxID=279262 RepID=A0A370H7P2_9NOCA|nr:class I SAM-dependent methyltransferase [Nocardia mexicana]RDI52707.1 methyltransferase family protein [Nocardia mexicana]